MVEILITLGIIALLAAMVFSVFARVREKGRQATCQSNLRQIGLVIQQYIQDNDGAYPSTQYFYGSGYYLNSGLPSQIKTRQVLWCPTGKQPWPGTFSVSECTNGIYPFPPPPSAGQCSMFFSNYRYNPALLDASTSAAIGNNESKLLNTASFIIADDIPTDNRYRSVSVSGCPFTVNGDIINGRQYAKVHSDGANVLFGDDHVKWLSPETAAKVQCAAVANLPSP